MKPQHLTVITAIAALSVCCTPHSSQDHVDATADTGAHADTGTHADTGAPAADASNEGKSAMKLTSSAFQAGSAIPTKYTCQGDDISPALAWTDPPSGTKTFALIVDDPDAPDPKAPKMTWVHWVLFNVPASMSSLPEALKKAPAGASDGLNDWKKPGYGGPCPPIGQHRYFFKLYALDTTLTGLNQPNKAALETAMKGHVLGETQLIGVYQKK